MNLEDVDELFEALKEAGITLGFGMDACTNIPNPYDAIDAGWHLMLRDEGLYGGREEAFNRILDAWAWSRSTRSSWAGPTSASRAAGSSVGHQTVLSPISTR